ncbi:hypothetical protein BKA69DRAFT_148674 [Paraphysoderma sedebokerense]|nr:hypothetical protein BKA69DRAFT_148674 [Paraphysoderma sedebokerense]
MGSPIKSLRYLNRNPSFLKQRTYVTGSALPTINIAAFDLYEQPVYTLPNETFFMGIEIYPATPLDSNPWSIIRGESAKAIISGSVSFSSLKLYGSTGPHILSFTSLTDQYDSSIYFINETINISPCDGGKIMESLPGTTISVCSDPVCTQGCLPNQGVCVQKDTCQCLDGWEGVDCGLPKEYYDGLSLILSLSGSNESGSDQAVVETAQLPELRSQIMSVLNREMEGKGDVVFRSMDVNAELSNPKRLRSVPTFSSLTSSESSKQTVITIQVLIKSEDSSTFLEGDSLAEFYPLLQSEFPSSIYLPSNQTASVSLSSLKITNSPKIYVTIADPTVIAVLLLTGICLLGTIGIMIVFTKSRQTAAVKSSSYVFCMLICLGFVLGYISIPLYTGIPTKGSCVAQIWLLALSMGMVVG